MGQLPLGAALWVDFRRSWILVRMEAAPGLSALIHRRAAALRIQHERGVKAA